MRIYLLVILVMVFSSCVRNKKGQNIQVHTEENQNVFEVAEVIHGNTYTYMKVKEKMGERWVATGKTEVDAGDVLYYGEALQMNDFTSKELDRTFDEIYFIDQVSEEPISADPARIMPPHSGSAHGAHGAQESEVSLDKADDELTVGQIYANPQEYSGEEVEIRGVVVKVNNEIMGKNWVHIQDGTGSEGDFDLTVTTTDKAEVGDEVTFKGKITLEKDFGAGYYYDVIMEEAELLNTTGSKV